MISSYLKTKFSKKYDIVHALDGFPHGFVSTISSFGLRKKIFITDHGEVIQIYLREKNF